MKPIAIILMVFTAVFVGFSAPAPRQVQNDDIREVVFRYQLEHRSFAQREKPPIYFFAVADKEVLDERHGLIPGDGLNDPTDDLMRRFKSHKPPIKKNTVLQNRRSGDSNPGVRLRITEIKWISDTEVEVKGGHDDAWSSSWSNFTVKKENGEWKVIKAELKRGVVA